MDKNKDWLISCNDCRQVFRKLRVPITDGEVDELICALDRNDDGHLDYRELLKGRLAYKMERRQKKKKDSTVEFSPRKTVLSPRKTVLSPQYLSVPDTDSNADDGMCSTDSITSDSEDVRQQKREKMRNKQKQHLRETKKSPESTQSIRIKQHVAASTLPEPAAQRVDHYRQEELKQFQNLLLYCKTHGAVLNQSLLERGEWATKAYGKLLLVQNLGWVGLVIASCSIMKYCTIVWPTLALLSPGDQDCARKLKQQRPALLSSHFADPPVEEEEVTGNSGLIECFGGPYLQLRG